MSLPSPCTALKIMDCLGMTGMMESYYWLDEDALMKLKEDRVPFDAPSSIYTPKPNDLGKIIWLSGT
jgi:hypothetical protein